MGMGMFSLTYTNPNVVAGGSGCACAPTQAKFSTGPYLVFTGTEQADPLSPYTVVCASCVHLANTALGIKECECPPSAPATSALSVHMSRKGD